MAAGWVYPLAFLISNGWIRSYGCNSIRAAAEYFSKSCVPGAISAEYNTGVPYDNMCDLCHGASYRLLNLTVGQTLNHYDVKIACSDTVDEMLQRITTVIRGLSDVWSKVVVTWRLSNIRQYLKILAAKNENGGLGII